MIDYIRNVVLLAFHIYLNAHHSTTSPPGISDLATGLMCIHKCRIKVTRKVHNSEKKEKKKRIPSSIYSWSIGHILEHEFFCLGLGCAGSKGKKWIWDFLSNFWGCFFFNFLRAKIFFCPQKVEKTTLKSCREKLKFTFFSTAQMAQTEEFMFQNVAYRPTVYRTGPSPNLTIENESKSKGCEIR